MTEPHPSLRIFVLGAGFSVPAGLPLAVELFSEVRKLIEQRDGHDTKFQYDLENYIEYRTACDGATFNKEVIDLEEFMSFLDMEHFLELRGSKAWSQEGNESQLIVRKAIGEVIHRRTPPADRLPDCYYRFAEQLSETDTVFTLNYDILLERALEHVGKPYQLFPDRFKSIGKTKNVLDTDVNEVMLLKLHGSVDWCNDRLYLESKASIGEQGIKNIPAYSLFNNPERYGLHPIVDGPRPPNDPLLHIHKIRDLDAYYANTDGLMNAPFILSPSYVKFVYYEPLLSFWNGMGRIGGQNLGVSIIGFSLPKHDEYIRICLYQIISNYQQSWWDEKIFGELKDHVRIVDYQPDDDGVAKLKSRYNFIDATKANYFLDGFGNDAVEFLFFQQRKI